jgi:hypothetical protein
LGLQRLRQKTFPTSTRLLRTSPQISEKSCELRRAPLSCMFSKSDRKRRLGLLTQWLSAISALAPSVATRHPARRISGHRRSRLT